MKGFNVIMTGMALGAMTFWGIKAYGLEAMLVIGLIAFCWFISMYHIYLITAGEKR